MLVIISYLKQQKNKIMGGFMYSKVIENQLL